MNKFAQDLQGTKVVDEKGQPRRVHHGTTQTFGQFDPNKLDPNALYGPGIYFTEDPEIAQSYSKAIDFKVKRFMIEEDLQDFMAENPNLVLESRKKERNSGIVGLVRPYDEIVAKFYDRRTHSPNVRSVYLNIQNPFDIDQMRLTPQQLQEMGWKGKYGSTEGNVKRIVQNHPAFAADLRRWMERFGHDGMTHIGGEITGGKSHRVWIAFDPAQVIETSAALAWVRRNCRFAQS